MTDETPVPPRRLRSADVIDDLKSIIAQLTERRAPSAPTLSVDFTRNAKHETQISVKLAASADADLDSLPAFTDRVYEEALRIYERAAMRFPTSEGLVTADAPPAKSK